MGHFSLVSNWRSHLGAIFWFLKSLLTVSFLDFNWAELAPHDTGKCEWILFSLIIRVLSRPQSSNLPRWVLKTASHQLRGRHKAQMLPPCHRQVRNAEQVEERNVPKFCSPLEEVVFYSALLHSIGLIVGAGVWPAIWLVITFMKSFRCLMLSSKEVNHPLPEIHSG